MVTFCFGAIFGALNSTWISSMPGGRESLQPYLWGLGAIGAMTLVYITPAVLTGHLDQAVRIAQNFSGYTVGTVMVCYHVFFAKKS